MASEDNYLRQVMDEVAKIVEHAGGAAGRLRDIEKAKGHVVLTVGITVPLFKSVS